MKPILAVDDDKVTRLSNQSSKTAEFALWPVTEKKCGLKQINIEQQPLYIKRALVPNRILKKNKKKNSAFVSDSDLTTVAARTALAARRDLGD